MSYNPLLLFAINRLPGHSGWLKHSALSVCSDEKDLPLAIAEYKLNRSSRATGSIPAAERLLREAESEIRRLNHYNIGYKVLGDSDYPASLALIEDPPLILYYRGFPEFNKKPGVAIVGTRRPSAPALRQAYQLGLECSLADYPVVSGLAFGIDRAVHEGALDGSGVTWAVLAGGLDRPSPFSHRRLAARILDRGGALLGEISPGTFPAKYAFPRRNRILSGLSRGCIVVQAPSGSGALITADFALDQNRDLYVASAGMEGASSEGTRNLERQGAPVISGISDVMSDWGRFLDIRAVDAIPGPGDSDDLVRMMKMELDGRLYRYMGGWFEYRGA
ncbi:MAG: DNA-processing protein DprA [Spirochaetaceae bacterium]|nr:DNA-processing protein DprA [Spirochaetaceae bacterium]